MAPEAHVHYDQGKLPMRCACLSIDTCHNSTEIVFKLHRRYYWLLSGQSNAGVSWSLLAPATRSDHRHRDKPSKNKRRSSLTGASSINSPQLGAFSVGSNEKVQGGCQKATKYICRFDVAAGRSLRTGNVNAERCMYTYKYRGWYQ